MILSTSLLSAKTLEIRLEQKPIRRGCIWSANLYCKRRHGFERKIVGSSTFRSPLKGLIGIIALMIQATNPGNLLSNQLPSADLVCLSDQMCHAKSQSSKR